MAKNAPPVVQHPLDELLYSPAGVTPVSVAYKEAMDRVAMAASAAREAGIQPVDDEEWNRATSAAAALQYEGGHMGRFEPCQHSPAIAAIIDAELPL